MKFRNVLIMTISTALLVMAYGVASLSKSAAPKEFTNSLGIKMLRIEAGTFTMGETNPTPESLKGPWYTEQGDWDERPAHQVRISKPFYIAETPVRIEHYKQFKKEYTGLDLFDPYVSGVSWSDAVEFCRWLSRKEGKEYRLPTEAEWEYAARAGTKTLFWSGNEAREDAPNPWGLRDISYGVPEWCHDWYGQYPDADQVDPVGPASGMTRVVRDGGYLLRQLEPKDDRTHFLGSRQSNFRSVPSYFRRSANRSNMIPDVPSQANTGPITKYTHYIGFRVVQAAHPASHPLPVVQPFPLDCVFESRAGTEQGPDPAKPYFKARPILPIPPENDQGGGIEAVGLHPGVGAHIHSGGLAVAPNGDVVMISSSARAANRETDPNSTMIVSRLRRGAEQWDMPDLFYDLADHWDLGNLLWTDQGKIWFFGGGRYFGDVRFRYTTTADSGASWTNLTTPHVTEQKAFVEAQPITSAFRGLDGTIYFGADAEGGSSMLWTSRDNGKTWCDTGGRSAGRHTAFVPLKDGRILGMGGKSTDIQGYMPKVYSSDGGKSWSTAVKTGFAGLGGNQRPVILRLRSGRLFFASDFQFSLAQKQLVTNKPGDGWAEKDQTPAAIKERGSFVALSDDEGETWHIKKLELALPHESRQVPNLKRPGPPSDHDHSTIGYAAAAYAPNGVIHLMTSMNHPSQHFEMNEAWILSNEKGEANQQRGGSRAEPQKHKEKYPDGKIRATWSSRIGANGDYALHGTETCHYSDGKKKYEVTYQDGVKTGKESFWLPSGAVKWSWDHRPDGTATWTHY